MNGDQSSVACLASDCRQSKVLRSAARYTKVIAGQLLIVQIRTVNDIVVCT